MIDAHINFPSQAVSDLEDINSLDSERAANLIMAARAHWFEGEEQA